MLHSAPAADRAGEVDKAKAVGRDERRSGGVIEKDVLEDRLRDACRLKGGRHAFADQKSLRGVF